MLLLLLLLPRLRHPSTWHASIQLSAEGGWWGGQQQTGRVDVGSKSNQHTGSG